MSIFDKKYAQPLGAWVPSSTPLIVAYCRGMRITCKA